MDRETVIKGLTCCSQHGDGWCAECPYHDVCIDGYGIPILASCALELLGEQEKRNEPMLMTNIGDTANGIEVGICPVCNKSIVNDLRRPTKYCKFCGQAVKWE